MPDYYCPRCCALISADFLLTADEQFDCPECHEPVRMELVAPDLAAAATDRTAEGVEEETPPGSRLSCRLVGDRLVLYIPPGSSKPGRSLGLSGVFWTGFTAVFTVIMTIIGGGASKKHEKFFPYFTVQTKVVPAEMLNEAGIVGAALAAEP